ncbi:ribosome recycling factor [Tistlia consotensis]|uniref:Ribosome-recycling factor n=1 Tax=Tistlia consotensis USBA 355 TaxID=560819 RepID=A0A1Y6CQY8_9PROT|nr:ribosome recycling factor [Tistlia consotensis]SMF70584.1 ribosome recycling factor [Tistlia consotensis USBA 355]SNS04552.1 ribosome recycling factor [Tistlia consotensis]
MADALLKDIEKRMDSAVEAVKREFGGLRTGRASTGLLEPIMVDAYGAAMPLNQVATISVPEPRMIVVSVWDRKLSGPVEKAIRESGLGLNPASEGATIRVPIPPLSEERRQELVKVAGKYAEHGKVAVRNVRRDGMEALKKLEKDHEISEDEHRRRGDEVQKLTDQHVQLIDEAFTAKQAEIMQV